jgi:hypothetical protein
MPTIGVDKAALFKELGREYTTEEFDELCFEFGIELDEDTSQSTKPEDLAQPPQLKIEIPANRYDMLCFEGIAMNLKVFLEQQKLPKWTLTAPKDGELQVLDIKQEVRLRVAKPPIQKLMVLIPFRLLKYGPFAPVSYYGTLSSPRNDTTPSLRSKTSYTPILHANGHWYRSEHTTWIVGVSSIRVGLWLIVSSYQGPLLIRSSSTGAD